MKINTLEMEMRAFGKNQTSGKLIPSVLLNLFNFPNYF